MTHNWWFQAGGESEAAFHKRIDAREADIAARGPATDGTGGLIEVRHLRIPDVVGRTFVDSDPMRPFLSLELQAGISPEPGGMPAGSSLHEDAILDLRGAISSSIRLRPHALPEPEPGATATATANAGNAMPGS